MKQQIRNKWNKIALASLLCVTVWGCSGNNENSLSSDTVSNDQDTVSEAAPIQDNRPDRTAAYAAVEPEEKDYSDTMLPEEIASIQVGKLSPDHEYYEEVLLIDPECADYINEISIYDKEIDDTFVVHVSLPPDYDENTLYPTVVMTDGVWRLSDHPEIRQMMLDGEIQDIILVSIGYPNNYDYETIRERDLVDDPGSYLHFIVDNLIPYLEDNYPISPDNMTLTGHSFGGYWAYYALFHSDTIGKNTFANYFIGSPSVQAMTGATNIYGYEEQYYERSQTLNANVYVTVGGDESPAFIDAIENFNEQVQSRNYEGLNMTYEVIEGYNHNLVFKPSIRNTVLMFYGL